MIRPRRQAAIVASMKIKQYYDKNTPTALSCKQFPRTCQVINTRDYIRDCLDNIAVYPEKKVDIVIRMLQHLISYPMILLVHPRFREVVMKKMDEFEVSMQSFHEFKKKIADMEQSVHDMNGGIYVTEEIISHLHAIDRIHSSSRLEKNMMGYDELHSTIENLRSIIKGMSSHSDYVSN